MTEHDTDPMVEQKLKQLYRSLSTEQPPASLDRQILRAAHDAVDETGPVSASGRSIWLPGLAYAAVLVVAVSVIIELSMQPEIMPADPALLIEERRIPTTASEALPEAKKSTSQSGPSRRAEQEAFSRQSIQRDNKVETRARARQPVQEAIQAEPDSAAIAPEVQALEMVTPASDMLMQAEGAVENQSDKAWRISPELWLQHCQRLLEANRVDELAAELEQFARQYEDYPVPQNLLDWAKQSSSPRLNP